MEFDDFSDGETVGASCVLCGDTPCRWVLHRSEVIRRVEDVYGDHLRSEMAGGGGVQEETSVYLSEVCLPDHVFFGSWVPWKGGPV